MIKHTAQHELDFASCHIPQHMRYGLLMYIEKGIMPGDFLYAVLCNNLVDAAGHADYINKHALTDYATYLYNYAPRGCWGSKEAVAAWAEHRATTGEKND